jgi:outer membrane protein TolC
VQLLAALFLNAQTLRLDSSTISLLPLNQLIDSALQHSPLLKQQDALILKKELLAKIEKRKWMNTLSLTGSAAYGTGNNLSVTNQGPVLTNSLTTQTTIFYNAGVTFYLPLANLFNTKTQIKAARQDVIYQESKREEVEQNIKKEIITAYQNLILLDKKLTLKSSKLNTYQVSKDLAFEQMQNGIINITEYNETIETYNAAMLEMEEVKNEMITAYLILEMLVGSKIIKTQK